MKTIILSILIFIGANYSIYSQITIGSNLSPNSGALLDLKESNNIGANSSKGLTFPRVSLERPDILAPCVTGDLTTDVKNAHIGLCVYNVTFNKELGLCPGFHVWDGMKWDRIAEDCTATLTAKVPVTCVADGYEYYLTFDASGDWLLEIEDVNGVITSDKTPIKGGTVNGYTYKFKTSAALSHDADIKFVFTSPKNYFEKQIFTTRVIPAFIANEEYQEGDPLLVMLPTVPSEITNYDSAFNGYFNTSWALPDIKVESIKDANTGMDIYWVNCKINKMGENSFNDWGNLYTIRIDLTFADTTSVGNYIIVIRFGDSPIKMQLIGTRVESSIEIID